MIEQATNTLQTAHECSNFWMYVSILLFSLLLYIKGNEKRDTKLDKFKDADVDMSSVMNDINKSRDLYKELSRKYHPDRFTDPSEKEKAEDLMKRITKNRNSFSELSKIKEEL